MVVLCHSIFIYYLYAIILLYCIIMLNVKLQHPEYCNLEVIQAAVCKWHSWKRNKEAMSVGSFCRGSAE